MTDIDPALLEKAAKVLRADYESEYDADHIDWSEFADIARAVLEAVAPAIAAQALRDAANHFDAIGRHNPGGFYSEATAYADGQDSATEAAVDWLRERADQLEKENR